MSEAVTNAAKHAGATRIAVAVASSGGRLHVAVRDDGRGGADPRGGLSGLARRVAAVDGTFQVRSPGGRADGRRGGAAVRVTIAEDSALLREGLVRPLADEGHEVVAAVGDARALFGPVERDPPDVCVVDVRMPPTHTDEGVRAALEIRERWPDVAVLVLSQHVERRYAAQLVGGDGGRVGYLLQDRVAQVGEFLDALERVAAGGAAFDPEVVRQLLARRTDPLQHLTPRERDVLDAMAQGLTNAGIAERLRMSVSAVEKHAASIFDKLALDEGPYNRRVQAILRHLGG